MTSDELAYRLKGITRMALVSYNNHPHYEDLFAGAWLATYERVTALEERTGQLPTALFSYAAQAVRWYVADYFKERRRCELPYAEPGLEGAPLWHSSEGSEDEWEHRLHWQAVKEAVEKLPDLVRAPLLETALAPESPVDWSRRHGLHPGVAKRRIFRAREMLLAMLAEDEARG